MMFRQYILLLCCLAGVLTVPRPALSDGASYGSLARRPRIVYHDGRALLTNPPAAGASAPFLQPYHRDVAAIQASEKGAGALFPMTTSAVPETQLTVWKPLAAIGLPPSPVLPPPLMTPLPQPGLRVDPFGPVPVKLAALPRAVPAPAAVLPSGAGKAAAATPYLVRPARPDTPAVTVTRPPIPPGRPAPGGPRVPIRR